MAEAGPSAPLTARSEAKIASFVKGTPTQAPPFVASLTGGALAGLSVDLLFYPIDTIKTRLQAKGGFLQAGGFKGVYRGIGSVAVGSAPGAALFFVTYESLKPALAPLFGDGASSHMLAGSLGEVAACLIRVPTEVIKSRQQTSSYGASASSANALRAVIAESGLRGLYRGFAGTVGREIPFTCIQFPLYEALKRRIARSNALRSGQRDSSVSESYATTASPASAADLPTWQAGLAGSAAGGIAAASTTPLDVVKTRIMLERRSITQATEPAKSSAPALKASGVNSRIIPTLLHVARTEGLAALFAGVVPRTLWISGGGFVFLGTAHFTISALGKAPLP
ncbi:mitochondrial carrier [Ceraceosorus guamensis]|uniref:Mitochondrial carrier n=1 Tax=Ceraceosorus guamensis TaxID=1522189 RepID=A0A316W2X7_9BASI|nr:mitochondrial carrier [Ceraceosorus guamensis]PWN44049.1 mitochondrial carrier [Ceraceosorus guamensis]